MTSSPAELQQLLQAGITALQRGERERGRELLLRVVEQDEQQESAWLWLSRAVDDPHDVETALENALALNPDNAEAKTRLLEIQRLGKASGGAGASSDNWRSLLPHAPVEPEDGMDDPWQCVYCGRPTQETDRKCPHCGQSLYVNIRQSRDSEYLRWGLLLLGVLTALAVVQIGPPLLAVSAAQSENKTGFEIIRNIPGLVVALGDFLKLEAERAPALIDIFGVRAALLAAALTGLSQRWALAYFAALVMLAADLILNGYLLFSGGIAVTGGLLNLLLVIGILALLAASYQEFMVVAQRLLTTPDVQLRSADAFYRRGHDYAQMGMRALAVAQWRKAVGLAPKEAAYYKTLGLGFAQIQRFERSLRALEEAHHQDPRDRDLPKIIALVKEQAAKARAK
jgi:tetratricopeptide (TPR) repeat protein